MAVGKPIIASNIAGFTSVLTDGVEGITVPPRNAEKLSKAINRLMKDKELREQMGAKGKPKAMQYDWSIIARKLLDVYNATLGRTT